MSKCRHWKQRWDPDAPLVFRKTMTLEGKIVKAGSPVTRKMRKKLGANRLKIWWQGGFLELKDWKPAVTVPDQEVPDEKMQRKLIQT